MAEIIFRLPSKVQYGYVEVRGTPEEFGITDISDPYAMGIAYMAYGARYNEGESEGVRLVKTNGSGLPATTYSPETQSVKEYVDEAAEGIAPPSGADEDEMQAAADMLRALGPMTEVKPWDKPRQLPSKPWEKKNAEGGKRLAEKAAPKAAKSGTVDFDFSDL